MKQIKLKNPKSIRGVERKSGDIIDVSTNGTEVKTNLNCIGILCAENLIKRGEATEFNPKKS